MEQYVIRTADRGANRRTFEQAIIDACDRHDDETDQGAVSDLHATGEQYHKVCHESFMAKRSIRTASLNKNQPPISVNDSAFQLLVSYKQTYLSQIRNSVEVHFVCRSYGGDTLTRREMVKKISQHFGKDLLMSGDGVASIIVFKSK